MHDGRRAYDCSPDLCCGASDTDSQGDFVNACSVERAEGPQCGDEAEMLNDC